SRRQMVKYTGGRRPGTADATTGTRRTPCNPAPLDSTGSSQLSPPFHAERPLMPPKKCLPCKEWRDDMPPVQSHGSYGGDPQAQFEEIARRLRRLSHRRLWLPLLGIVLLLWIASGLYMVGPGEVGVILQFGKFVGISQPGLNYRLPKPIQEHH